MITAKKTILKITAKEPQMGVVVEILAEKEIQDCHWSITDAVGNVCRKGNVTGTDSMVQLTACFEAQMWSVADPVLYTFSAELNYKDGSVETIRDRFGFRYFSCDNKYIYLNGYPFYVRAYIRGCTAHEHENNCRLVSKEFYRKNILMAKKYGFNAIRFHSVVPPRECFEAADELGILIHIETRAENEDYNNLTEMLYGKNDFVSDKELQETIDTLYNHPSFMVYCIGNEIRMPGKTPRIREIRDYIKKKDPTRLFIDTCAHGEYDRDYVDFDVQHMGYFFPYGRNANMFSDTDNLLCFGTVEDRDMVVECGKDKIKRKIAFQRPILAHEVCHYTSWRDFYALRDKFRAHGVEAPWWVEEEIKMLEAKGYKEDFPKLFQITKDFQYRCWKTALEGIRSSNLLSGFHMLQFADTDRYENSNGVVDCFDDYQGVDAESFRRFNQDTVLIARLPKAVYEEEEKVKIPVILSQFALNPPKRGTFSYTIAQKENICSGGSLTQVDTGKSGVYELCILECVMPAVKQGSKFILECSIAFEDGSTCVNSWELWVFPKTEERLVLSAQQDMQGDYLNTKCRFWQEDSLILTDKLDDGMFEWLEQGRDVLLLYRTDWTRHLLHKNMTPPKYSFRHTWDRFKGVIWDRGTINGGYDDAELLNQYGFCTDGQINYQYYTLIDDCDKINLDDFPVNVKSLVSGIDKSSRDRFDPTKFGERELMYDRTMRNFSYCFELQVGKGRLLVTGFNFTGVNSGDTAACAMLKTLINYCKSDDFAPKAYMSVEELKDFLQKTAAQGPQKERMMTQYWQLDNEPVESMQYWEESEKYLK